MSNRLLEMNPDFNNDLYCWCYILYKAHIEGKTLQEVVEMTPEVATFSEQNTGYQQFCNQYDLVAGDTETRRQYFLWVNEQMRREGEIDWRVNAAITGIVRNLLGKGMPIDEISEVARMPVDEVVRVQEELNFSLA